ncbi:uncharacterized protein LOC115071729 [Nannospalax galili]|uniref:uncharacterized protein LOC115071729 n=1 Tax=Nannospalax galili TaxID=1026970 RepID=UPI00111BF537|nr:uncharacterized protein LOC115071729 [Nannospalax galili]
MPTGQFKEAIPQLRCPLPKCVKAPLPQELPHPSPDSTEPDHSSPPSSRLRLRRDRGGPSDGTGTAQIFPLQTVGDQIQYWPFPASDLYNWKTHNPSFSQDPQALTALIESILTHQPTWEDCQQLLQALLTTEERQRVILEAQKNVPGEDGRPTQLPNEIDAGFPLTRHNWDPETVADRECLRLYRQTLLAGLKVAGRCPTNLAKVRAITQGENETPAGFLEHLIEGYRMYTPFDPTAQEHQADFIMAFIGQSAPDIPGKLQRLEGLQRYSLQDLVREAEKIYNKRETSEEREDRIRKEQEAREDKREKKKNKELSRILATVVQETGPDRDLGDKRRPRVDKDQCAYCKERGHWARECPKKLNKLQKKTTPVLTLGDKESRGQELPPEPRVTLRIGGQLTTFTVDTRAQHSVLTTTKGPMRPKTAWVQGATGEKTYRWTTERKVDLSTGQVSHSFLLVPDCPYPLLGRDLLSKLGAHIHFTKKGATVQTAWVQGATGEKTYRWTTERKVDLSTGQVSHSFLLVPDCPYPLLGSHCTRKRWSSITGINPATGG